MTKDEKTEFCLKEIKKIQDSNSTLDTHRLEAQKFYRGDSSIVPTVAGRSKATTTDLMDTIEWIKPSLLKIFTSGDDAVSLQPSGAEDVEPVRKQNLLVNRQLKVKNNWFLILNDWFDDAMKCKTGTVKYQWFKDVKIIEKDYEDLTDDEFQAKASTPNSEIIEHTETIIKDAEFDPRTAAMIAPPVKSHAVKVRYTIEDEYPLIEPVPPEEIGYPLDAKNIADCPFVYHRTSLSKNKFIKKYGKDKFKAVEDMNGSDKGDASNDINVERLKDLGGEQFLYNKEKDEYIVYECYYYDEDYIAQLVALCGEEILLEDRNKYDCPPFEVITPIKLAHRLCGMDMFDLLKELQQLRTALLRQIVDNVYFGNNKRYFLDPNRINMDDYLNNNTPGAAIRTKGPPAGVAVPEDKALLSPEIFSFYEMLNVEKDYHSGVPRSFQGVNPNVLSETWRGQNQQVSQASQRVEMIARIFAEMGVAPLVSKIVDLNLKFLKKKTAVRYLNDWIDISPDNIVGKYDVTVNVGVGANNKDQTVMHMQQLLGLYAQIKSAGIPVVTSQNFYNAMKELLIAMGRQNTADFITEPKIIDSVMALVNNIMKKMQASGVPDPEVMGLIENVANMMGAGGMSARTMADQKTPEQPSVPFQPSNVMTKNPGGGYFG